MLGLFLTFAVTMGGGLLYVWLMLAYRDATLGKMALGIKVVNQVTGEIPGLGPAFVRALVPFAASLFCPLLALLVYLSPLFDNSGRLQGWHDKAANDLVIKVRSPGRLAGFTAAAITRLIVDERRPQRVRPQGTPRVHRAGH
jgi:uncharacterized RDD family membrane protein YckC